MAQFLYPLIQSIWRDECIPKIWNKGHITSLWKGRGDKEQLLNHRGITTSSAIGTILEAAIDKRIERTVKFSQAQGGGKRKASTFDHLFILRAIIDISKKEKRETFLTFYDVSKAYDNANNDDMLSIIWDYGLKGKTWRILHKFSSDLSAIVKTRYGQTREFAMEIGGRQGSRLPPFLLSFPPPLPPLLLFFTSPPSSLPTPFLLGLTEIFFPAGGRSASTSVARELVQRMVVAELFPMHFRLGPLGRGATTTTTTLILV